ncbi:MAG: FMN-binding protein [Clostridia bacterium]
MRKYIILFAVVFALAGLMGVMIGCRKPVEDNWKDGVYFAMQEDFSATSGWKSTLMLVVSGGKITEANWDAAHISAGKSKKQESIDGEYRMVELGNSISEWHEQAALVEAFLVETQNVHAINVSSGYTDSITGVTIRVTDFVALTQLALNKGPVGLGPYSDGPKYAESADFNPNSGWKSTLNLTVINGYVAAANWSAVHKDGGKDKKTSSIDGEYKMVELGQSISEWHEQALLIEKMLYDTQDPSMIPAKSDGYADAISGVTIRISDFIALANEALK